MLIVANTYKQHILLRRMYMYKGDLLALFTVCHHKQEETDCTHYLLQCMSMNRFF